MQERTWGSSGTHNTTSHQLQKQQQRRALAEQIQGLAAKKSKLKRGSEEFQALAEKQRELMKAFRALAPSTEPPKRKSD